MIFLQLINIEKYNDHDKYFLIYVRWMVVHRDIGN